MRTLKRSGLMWRLGGDSIENLNHELILINCKMNTKYDSEIKLLLENRELRWFPWVGENYDSARILLIGDSNYEDGGNVDAKDYWTREFIRGEGFYKELQVDNKHNSKLLRSVEKTFLSVTYKTADRRKFLWSSVTYLNLSQKAVKVQNGKYERPTVEDFEKGWDSILKLFLIMKPNSVVKLGVSGEGNFVNKIRSNKDWEFKGEPSKVKNNILGIYERSWTIKHIITGYEVTIVFINHPSGSRGYKTEAWRTFIFSVFTEFAQMFK